MSRWRQAFDRIGGPDAVTWPAFWVTYLLSLFGHLAVGGVVTATLGIRVVIVTAAQVAMFMPLVLLRLTVLRRPPRPRPWIAVGGFVVAAAVRGAVLSELLVASGAARDPMWLYRFVASLGGIAIPLLIMALVVSAMRAHTRSLEALVQVQSQLLATESRIVAEVTERNEQTLARVQERLRAELVALDSVQGADSVAELQRLATDVVRPMSHELAASLPGREASDSVVIEARVTWRQAVGQMVDRPPLQPLIAALLMLMVLTNVALGSFGPARGIPLALTMFASIIVLSIAANRLLAFALPRLRPGVAPLAVAVACLVVGYGSTAAASVFVPAQSTQTFVGAGGLFPSMIVLLSAVVATIFRQQAQTERELESSTERLRRQLVRLRQAQWVQQQALSRALHGPVQAAVTSAALRLDAAVRAGEAPADLLTDTRRSLLATIDVLEAADTGENSLPLALARIAGTWEGVCDVTSRVDGGAALRLAEDPLASSVVIDLMTEAVSNAVRHGSARRADIEIACGDGDLVTLVVRDDGGGASDSRPGGLGTTLLENCTLEWTRSATRSGCVLKVVLPTAVPSDASPAPDEDPPGKRRGVG